MPEYLANVASLVLVGSIAAFYLVKEHQKQAAYFGRKAKLTKQEQATLQKYKDAYYPILPDSRLPTLDKDGFALEDIAKSATLILYKAPIPTETEKSKLKEGDFVKLIFIDESADAERIWVEIAGRSGLLFRALVRNDSFDLPAAHNDSELWFHPNHIFAIQ